jgi:hypothetical protein
VLDFLRVCVFVCIATSAVSDRSLARSLARIPSPAARMLLHFNARNGLPGDAYQDHHRVDSRGNLVHVKQNCFQLSFLKICDCDSDYFSGFLLQLIGGYRLL